MISSIACVCLDSPGDDTQIRSDPSLSSYYTLSALELHPFSLKPLLRRAMAYEAMERYRKAYVDYKTVLQIDSSVQAAHDSVHR